jgi:hypothetical protein
MPEIRPRDNPRGAQAHCAGNVPTTGGLRIMSYRAMYREKLATAEAIVSIAHPLFQDELAAEAEKMHIWKKSDKRE